jgi:hypothetical protein
MVTTHVFSQKRVHEEVESNDGEFAKVQTVGIKGIEKSLILETIQLHLTPTKVPNAP